jgi:hypothetical protein
MPRVINHTLRATLIPHTQPNRSKAYPITFSFNFLTHHNHQEKDKTLREHASVHHQQKRLFSTDQCQYSSFLSSTRQLSTMSSSKRFKFSGITFGKPTDTTPKTPFIVSFYDPDVQAKDAHDRTMEQILMWADYRLEDCHNYIQMLFPVPEGSAYSWEAPIIDRETIEAFRSRSELRNQLRRAFERMLNFYGFTVTMQPEKGEEEPRVEKDESIKPEHETQDRADLEMTESSATTTEEKSDEIAHDASSAPATSDAPTTSTETPIDATETTDTTASKGKESEKQVTSSSDSSFPPSAHSQRPPFSGYFIVRAPHWRKNFRNWAVRFDHNHLRITRILRCLRVLGLQTECDAFYNALRKVFDDPAINISERSMTYWTRAVRRPLYIAPDDTRVEWLREWEEEWEAKVEAEKYNGETKHEAEKNDAEKKHEVAEQDGKNENEEVEAGKEVEDKDTKVEGADEAEKAK